MVITLISRRRQVRGIESKEKGSCHWNYAWTLPSLPLDSHLLLADFDKIIVHVRHAEDPFLYIEAMTRDTLDFGSASGDIRSTGGIFFIIGALLGVQPCYLIYLLCRRNDEMEKRLKQYERVMEEENWQDEGRIGGGGLEDDNKKLTERKGWGQEDGGIELSIRNDNQSL